MMGLSYNDLYDLTPRSFSNASKGFFELRKENIRTSWEQTRVIAHITASPHLKNKIKAQELLPFPWDNETRKKTVKIASPEEIRKVIESYENKKITKIN
jgi:hypothetical protein